MSPLNTDGPWLTSREAQAYVRCKTLKSWYAWRTRRGIIPFHGLVRKADIDRTLVRPRKRRTIHPHSLANLRQRSA